MPSASALAAASENEIAPNALAENPTLKPRKFNADEPICLFPRFDTLGGGAGAASPRRLCVNRAGCDSGDHRKG